MLTPLIGPGFPQPPQPGSVHQRCTHERGDGYPARDFAGPVAWQEPNPAYHPSQFTHPTVLASPVWADPPRAEDAPHPFRSYEGEVAVVDGAPRNPHGRTNVTGRGLLGHWGANFAADPIVTRVHDGKLEMIAIERKDTHQWAIPGGMVDFGEPVSGTLSRELAEEALGKEARPEEVKALEADFRQRFERQGHEVFAGYCDDPRNTDNAWMETRAVHLHLEGHEAEISLEAGDDAGQAQWLTVDRDLLGHLYASHGPIVGRAVLDFQSSTGQQVLSDGSVRQSSPTR